MGRREFRRNNGSFSRKTKIKRAPEGLVLSIKCPNEEVSHILLCMTRCVELVTWPYSMAKAQEVLSHHEPGSRKPENIR